MEPEIFTSLRVAGIDGQIDAVLSDDTLILERNDGKGMRIDLDTIVRLRHHHVAVTPPLITLFGIIAIVASLRVLDGRPQIYSFILGVSAILVWALGRRPALCVDTRQGDRHILYGRDHRLQRMYIMVDRMSGGASLEEARLGLEELQQPEFLPIGSIDDIHHEVQSVEAAEAQLHGNQSETTLEEALANIRDRKERACGSEPVFDAELFNEPPTPTASAHTEEVGFPKESMFGRASRALQEQREEVPVTNQSYDSPFQSPSTPVETVDSAYQRCWGRPEPMWYNEREEDDAPLSRVESAAMEASSEAGGMFGIFDQLDDYEEATKEPAGTTLPAPASTTHSWQRPNEERPSSSYSMLSSALGSGSSLPEPTREALRPEVQHVTPGLVATARVPTSDTREPGQYARRYSYLRASEGPLDEYPALSRMHRQGANDSRLRLKPDKHLHRRGAFAALGEWVRPGLRRLEQRGRELTKLIIGDEGYRETYGDSDGNEGDQFIDAELRSNQLLRLRSDQDSQSDIAERLRLLTRNGGGAIADDLASRTLRGISDSGRSDSPVLDDGGVKKLDSPPSFEQMVCSSDPAPGFGGMRRLG